MRRAALAVALAASLAGCAHIVAEPRLRTALVDAGLSDRDARCMAGRMVDRLSFGQLRKLEALRTLERSNRSLADYVVAVNRLGDAELIGVSASSAALCTTGFAR